MSFDCFVTYAITFTIVALGTDMMKKRYGFTDEETGSLVTFPYLICGILMVPLGSLSDRIGKRQTIVIIGGLCNLGTFVVFLLVPTCSRCYASVLPWFLLGLNQAIYYVLEWGAISYIVKEEQMNTAYGVLQCL